MSAPDVNVGDVVYLIGDDCGCLVEYVDPHSPFVNLLYRDGSRLRRLRSVPLACLRPPESVPLPSLPLDPRGVPYAEPMIFKPGHGWRGGGRPLDAELIRTARVQLMQVFGECINELAPHSAFGSIENRAGAVRERLLSALKTNALLAPVI